MMKNDHNKKRPIACVLILMMVLTFFSAQAVPARAEGNWNSGSSSVPKMSKEEIAQLLQENSLELPDSIYQTRPAGPPYSPGAVVPEALQAAANRLNALRKLAGLPDVALDATLCEEAQYGAVLIQAAGMSHTPDRPADMDEEFYRRGYAATTTSNLADGVSLTEAVDAFMWERDTYGGTDNLSTLGHRRWQLNPALGKVGFGACGNYVAEKVFDQSASCDYDFISWPASGYFPADVFQLDLLDTGSMAAPWSISLNPAKFGNIANAKVTLTNDRGRKWEFSREKADGYFNIDFTNCGIPNCIIFLPPVTESTGIYTVTVTGLTYQGKTTTLQYQVEFFDAGQLAQGRVACPMLEGTIYFEPATGTIVDGDDSMLVLDVPGTIGGYPVTSIGAEAFSGHDWMLLAYLPEGLTHIENYAFEKCGGLQEIYLPSTLKSVGNYAFDWCENLELIHFAGTQAQWREIVVGIRNYDFEHAAVEFNADYTTADADDVEIPEAIRKTLPAPGKSVSAAPASSPAPSNDGARAVFTTKSAAEDFTITDGVLTGYVGAGGNVTIPSNVVSIDARAFSGCKTLEGVLIPGSVKTIGGDAFSYCSNLTRVVMDEGVTKIGENAFLECTALTQAVIPTTVRDIGGSAFWHTPWQENQGDMVIVNGLLIEYQGVDKTVTVPKGVRKICRAAFYGNGRLEQVELPEGLVEIGPSAFAKCNSLARVDLPDSLRRVGSDAFYWCDRLSDITFPAHVTEVESSALTTTPWYKAQTGEFIVVGECLLRYGGSNAAVQVPDSVTAIADGAFEGSAVETVSLPRKLRSIGASAFEGCEKLTSIQLPESVTSLGERAFANCTALKTANVPGSVSVVSSYAFSGCGNLETVSFGMGVTCIDSYAFEACARLAKVTLPNTVDRLEYNAFYQCTALSNVVLSNRITELGSFVFEDCGNLNRVTIPPSVKSFGTPGFDGDIFRGCAALKICGVPGSEAEAFAKRYGYAFEAASIPTAGAMACASPQRVKIDGVGVDFYAYSLKDANGFDTNYVKLRDVAKALNGTSAQFEVGWEAGMIRLDTGRPYTANGTEMIQNFLGDQAYRMNASAIVIDELDANLSAITLTDASGGGYTYFKLRDLGGALGFDVDWNATDGIVVRTK